MLQFRLSAYGDILRYHATRPDGTRVVSGFFFLNGSKLDKNPRPRGFLHTWGEGSTIQHFDRVEDWFMALG